MQLSDRIKTLNTADGDGWAIYYEARRRMRAGADITMLTIGEHDVRTDPLILDAMDAAARGGSTGYTPAHGDPALRTAVAERLTARTGVATAVENVLIVPGGQAGLFAAHMAVLDPGDVGLLIDPYYATYPGTIRSAGGIARPVPTTSEDQFRPRPDALRAAAEGARSLLINSPNNPTGQVYDRKTLDGIAEVCLERDLWLISDEVYDTQVWTGSHLSPRALPDMTDRTIVVGSMSKSHAMTGSRMGWAVGPQNVIDAMADLATNTTYGLPGFIQMAAVAGLDEGPEFEAQVSAPFLRRRAIAERILGGANGLRLLPSDATMYVMVDVRPTGLSGSAFAQALLDAEGIAVMPGESFGNAAAGHLRIAMTVEDARFEAALVKIAAFAAERIATAAE